MNANVRTKRIEMMANPAEEELLDIVRGPVGRSPFLRGLLHAAARTHGMPLAPPKESRGCPGPGRVANRVKARVSMRRPF